MHSSLSRRLNLLAFLAPAAVALAAGWPDVAASAGVRARTWVAFVLAAAWVLAARTPRWRATLDAVGAALCARLGPPAWFGLAILALLFASGPQAAWFFAASAACAAWGAAAWVELRQRDVRRARGQLVLAAVWVACLALLEVAVARFVLPYRSHDKIFMQHDAVLGWRLRPDFSIERREKDYRSRESTSDLGFRTPQRPFEKPPGVRRVLLLGDSHSEAYTVDDDKTMAHLLEAQLGPDVEVVSLGVGGYSTDQELLSYVEVGRRFAPDLVILQFCGNDVPFNVKDQYWRGHKPRFVRYGELLVLRGVPVPDTKTSGLVPDFLSAHSAFFAFLEGQLRQLGLRQAVDEETDYAEAWRVTELLIRDLRRAVEGDGARLVCFHANVDDPNFDRPLQALLQRQGVPYLDIAPAYADDFASLWVSGHWNEKGQQRVADLLAPLVRAALDGAAH